MCEHCEKGKRLLEIESISIGMLQWCGYSAGDPTGAFEYTNGLFIDRGYLRLCDVDDAQCLDHGKKIKINFCPFCGNKLDT